MAGAVSVVIIYLLMMMSKDAIARRNDRLMKGFGKINAHTKSGLRGALNVAQLLVQMIQLFLNKLLYKAIHMLKNIANC